VLFFIFLYKKKPFPLILFHDGVSFTITLHLITFKLNNVLDIYVIIKSDKKNNREKDDFLIKKYEGVEGTIHIIGANYIKSLSIIKELLKDTSK
jgi:hypothetical protein